MFENMSISTSGYIYMYLVLVIVSLTYIYNYRKTLVADKTLNNKRDKAIEKFTTIEKSRLEKYTKEGFVGADMLPSNQRNLALGATCIKPDAIPKLKHIPDNSKYLLDDLPEIIQRRVIKAKLQPTQLAALDNLINSFLIEVVGFALDTYRDLAKYYSAATPANEFSREENIEYYLDKLPDKILQFTDTKLESTISRIFPENVIIRTNKSTMYDLVAKEIRERVFANVYGDTKNQFELTCNSEKEYLALQTLDADTSKTQVSADYLAEKQRLFQVINDAKIRNRLTLIILVRLTENRETQATIRKQLEVLKDSKLQPANETDIDFLNSQSRPYGSNIAEASREIEGAINKMPSSNANNANKAYLAYLDSLVEQDKLTKIDPIQILGNFEKKTVNFLQQLGNDLNTSSTSGDVVGKVKSINRFGTQTNNLGTYLTEKTPLHDTNIASGSTQKEPLKSTKEGFASVPYSAASTATQPLDIFTGFAKYIWNIVKQYLDSEMAARIESTLMKEDNMIPLGVLMIMLSILLYFIDISS